MSELIGEFELVFLAWRRVPFPEFFGRFDSVPFPVFLGRFASWQAALASNRWISLYSLSQTLDLAECSVAASGILAVLAAAVCCSIGSLSCSVAADGVKADLADNIVLLVE